MALACEWHWTVEAELHAVVEHRSPESEIDAVGVLALYPKFRPEIVTEPPEVCTIF
jgi:hypothetical protein